jgi:hypothetical protein
MATSSYSKHRLIPKLSLYRFAHRRTKLLRIDSVIQPLIHLRVFAPQQKEISRAAAIGS